MAFRPILAPLLVLLWAATAIISEAHATEHQVRPVAQLHHHHEHSCKSTKKSACHAHAKKVKRSRHAFSRHGGWTITNEADATPGPMSPVVTVAEQYQGLSERSDRNKLASFFAQELDISIDPVRTAWCAAFVNSVLAKAGYGTSGSIESTSFLDYGHKVKEPAEGDIVVMKGVSRRSPTHVGFYVGSALVNGKTYYRILGGNQSNRVQVSWFPAAKVIGIRRAG